MNKDKLWNSLQNHLGHTDEEIAKLGGTSVYVKMVENALEFLTHKVVAEVFKSHGCHSELRVGDRIVMNGNG